jgi:hypothetical protein
MADRAPRIRGRYTHAMAKRVAKGEQAKAPIQYWSHSSLMAFLRNPLAWHVRYVQKVYDTPRNPASVIGSAAHLALQHFYGGIDKEGAAALGMEYLRAVPDFELNFGKAKSKRAKKEKRLSMEREYLQAIGHYLEKPPKHDVLAVEMKAMARIEGIALPIKAVSDLVVESRAEKGALDIVDHKFVDTFSKQKGAKTLFVMQALFNYYTVQQHFGRPVRRFLVYECKKSVNKDGSPQLRRYVIDFRDVRDEFEVFRRLINDATEEISRRRAWLPNPSDMFEGEHSFDLYRMGLLDD